MVRSRTVAKTGIMSSANATMKGTMISITPSMTSLPDVVLRLEVETRRG
jgi:hypothetical protein